MPSHDSIIHVLWLYKSQRKYNTGRGRTKEQTKKTDAEKGVFWR
jgi:hypothetical protein